VYLSSFLIISFELVLSSDSLYAFTYFLDGVSDRLLTRWKNLGFAGSGTEWTPSMGFLERSMTEEGRSKKEGIMQIVAFPELQVVLFPWGLESCFRWYFF